MEYDSFEKMIIQDIMNQYPEYTRFLEKQFISSKVIVRKIFSYGFYTEFYVSNKDARILGAPNLMLGKNQWRINDLKNGSDYIFWIKDGMIKALEGFSYGEQWPSEIKNAELIDNTILHNQSIKKKL